MKEWVHTLILRKKRISKEKAARKNTDKCAGCRVGMSVWRPDERSNVSCGVQLPSELAWKNGPELISSYY